MMTYLHPSRSMISNVVFPTGIGRCDDLGLRDRFDVYYGMADNVPSSRRWHGALRGNESPFPLIAERHRSPRNKVLAYSRSPSENTCVNTRDIQHANAPFGPTSFGTIPRGGVRASMSDFGMKRRERLVVPDPRILGETQA